MLMAPCALPWATFQRAMLVEILADSRPQRAARVEHHEGHRFQIFFPGRRQRGGDDFLRLIQCHHVRFLLFKKTQSAISRIPGRNT